MPLLFLLGWVLGPAAEHVGILPGASPGTSEESPSVGAGDESEEIRILLDSGGGVLKLSSTGASLTVQGLGGMPMALARAEVRCQRGALVLAHSPTGGPLVAPLMLLPGDVQGAGQLRVLGRTLRGRVEVTCDSDRWTAINILPLETYLSAVLGGEMPSGFPAEALKAQAVAARSYALMRKIDARDQGRAWHVGATVLSQVYAGLAREDPRTASAVAATRGEVLALGVTPVEAYFHAACGGRTESGAAALGRTLDYLQPVSCPCAGHSPYSHWRVELSAGELGKALGFGAARSAAVLSRTATGRASRVRIDSVKGGTRTLAASQLRAAVGYQKLPSTWFEVREERGRFVFEGRGAGHGAGLCQWGARVLAEQGESYRDILAHYYPGTSIEKIY